MEKEKKTIWDKIGGIDYRYIYIVFIITLAIPIIQPIGMPMKVSPTATEYYNTLVNLPKGSVVLFEQWIQLASWSDIQGLIIANWKILWSIPPERDIKIIVYSSTPDSVYKINELMEGPIKPPKWREETYGETWVDLGYIAAISLGNEAGLASLAMDFSSVIPNDARGTPLMEIPLIQEVAARAESNDVLNMYDIDLLVTGFQTCSVPDVYIRQIWVSGSPAYKLPMLVSTVGACIPNIMPYFGADKPVVGWVSGTVGAAELETLSGFPGPGLEFADMNDLVGIVSIIFLVLGNMSVLGKKFLDKSTPREINEVK